MFTNVEKKLKGIAVIEFICGIVIAACLPVMEEGLPVPPAVLLISLISPWFIYAFAELLENTKKIRHTMEIVFAEDISKAADRKRQLEEAKKRESREKWEKAGLAQHSPYWAKGPEDMNGKKPGQKKNAE